MNFTASIRSHISDISRDDWERCLKDEAEGYDYYTACEKLAHTAYQLGAVKVMLNNRIVAVAPIFTLDYRLDTPLQGKLRKISDFISRYAPKLLSLKVLGVGSPLAERCHLGFAPELNEHQQNSATDALLLALEKHAEKSGIGLLAIKDLSTREQLIADRSLKKAGYSITNSLPIAVLDLPATEADYLAKLSANNRSSLKRKIRAAQNLVFECRTSIHGIETEIDELYEQTRDQSGYDYGDLETLPKGYFGAVMDALNGKALIMLYWLKNSQNPEKKGNLIGFNLLLLNEGTSPDQRKVIDKFIGRKHPEARDNNLYFVGWMDNVRYAQKHDYKMLQTGQTAYGEKLRLGSRLEPGFIYFRHRNWILNQILRFISKFIAFDKMDPDLRAHEQAKHK